MSHHQDPRAGRFSAIFLVAVMGIAAIGYAVGISDGVPMKDPLPVSSAWVADEADQTDPAVQRGVLVPATDYAKMRRTEQGPTSRWTSALNPAPEAQLDLSADIQPSAEEKLVSSRVRASRRAFNGAPPTIPHVIEKTDDAACYACHGNGIRIGDRRAGAMSHPFLANCLQCHAPPSPKPFTAPIDQIANTFVGLPAPLSGDRAFKGAPPTIPHSTWMRESCLACHGNERGWSGLETTHPWRINCQQCHAPSATLDQAVDLGPPSMLPPISVQ